MAFLRNIPSISLNKRGKVQGKDTPQAPGLKLSSNSNSKPSQNNVESTVKGTLKVEKISYIKQSPKEPPPINAYLNPPNSPISLRVPKKPPNKTGDSIRQPDPKRQKSNNQQEEDAELFLQMDLDELDRLEAELEQDENQLLVEDNAIDDSDEYAEDDLENYENQDRLLNLIKYYTWQSDVEQAHAYTPMATAYFMDTPYNIQEAKGPAMLKKVINTIKSFFPKGRFYFQRELHAQVLRATLFHILGDEYETTVDAVCEEYKWDGPKKNLFAIASRRSGKTTGMASVVAALLLCIPNIQIVVYSVALRTAQEFVRLVERYLQMHPLGRSMIINPGGSETLLIRGSSIGDIRRIRSFPSGGNAKNMGGSTPFVELVNKISPGVVEAFPPGPITTLPNGVKHAIGWVDAPCLIYHRTSNGQLGFARTFGKLLSNIRGNIEFELAHLDGVIVSFDVQTPKNKAVSRKPTDQTVRTPYEGNEIPTTLDEQIACWKSFLAARVEIFHDLHAHMNEEEVRNNPLNYPLPPDSAELAELKKNFPDQQHYSFQHHLSNKAYKALLLSVICPKILDNLFIPDGKWVMVRAPRFHQLKQGSKMLENWDPRLNIPYFEADAWVGHISSMFSGVSSDRPSHVEIYGPDGDLLNSLLLSSAARIGENLKFSNSVRIIRGQWASYRNSAIYLNDFYQAIQNLCSAMENVEWTHPVVIFVAFHMLAGGNDYVNDSLINGLGAKTLFDTFKEDGQAFAKDFVQVCYRIDETGVKKPQEFIVQPEALGRMLICAYARRLPSLKLNPANVEGSLALIQNSTQKLVKKDLVVKSIHEIAALAGQLSWTMTYFAAATWDIPVPDPFDTFEGIPIWGFQQNSSEIDKFGHVDAQWSKIAHTNHLIYRWSNPDVSKRTKGLTGTAHLRPIIPIKAAIPHSLPKTVEPSQVFLNNDTAQGEIAPPVVRPPSTPKTMVKIRRTLGLPETK